MTVVVYRERIPSSDPRLRRHVLHDSRSWLYPFDTTGLSIQSVMHQRTLSILDQGKVGSCTAECGLGVLGTQPYDSATLRALFVSAFGAFDQSGAYRLYSAEESVDSDGPYPPNDNGSTGLTLAKVLRRAGLIAGWTQTFSLDAMLKALTVFPLNVGTIWLDSMFSPGPDAVLTVDKSSRIAGGHEYEAVGYDATRGLIRYAQSWGPSFGDGGYFWMQAEDQGWLLSRHGDVTVFTPLSQPAPVPIPGDADAELAAAAIPWVAKPHIGSNHTMQLALQRWLATR